MRLSKISIRNFRRLEYVVIDIEDKETIFVGPNNSGKTSATAIFRCFLGGRDFAAHDFSAARIADFERFLASGNATDLPEISLDLWFTIDPNSIAFGRVFTLLPKLSDFTQVGFRLSYGVEDAKKLHEQYNLAYPADKDGKRAKTLFQYLAADGNLSRHSIVRYASLEETVAEGAEIEVLAIPLEPNEGKRLVKQLVRVEFIDAQRNINDDDDSRSNRLSTAFASFYRKNLEQAEYAAEAHKVIDENNRQLTEHYQIQFKPLFDLIKGLGVPSVNDRELRIISSLSPETALRGSTELLYVDAGREHELPELYNGLGFKNLIYMAIQARHFHSQWLMTAENRPLCLLIFIEEPEVHLHAQVQQTFIANIWSVIDQSAKAVELPHMVPQLVVTTHSSHVLEAVDFEKVRYFQRRHLIDEAPNNGIRNASDVRSLRAFQPEADVIDGFHVSPAESLAFLKRYLRLTHCDLFFADAAILVEGAVEKLLMPSMIEKSANRLRSTYITVLEVSAANIAAAAAHHATADKQAYRGQFENKVRALARRIKAHPGYTDALGSLLGIVGAEIHTDLTDAKPVLKAADQTGGNVVLSFQKYKSDGINIYSQRENESEFVFLARDTQTRYAAIARYWWPASRNCAVIRRFMWSRISKSANSAMSWSSVARRNSLTSADLTTQ